MWCLLINEVVDVGIEIDVDGICGDGFVNDVEDGVVEMVKGVVF